MTGSAADRLVAWSESDMRPLGEYGPWDTLREALADVVSESTAAENERCLEVLRAIRATLPERALASYERAFEHEHEHDPLGYQADLSLMAKAVIGEALSLIEVGT